jgi:hypothetical protein
MSDRWFVWAGRRGFGFRLGVLEVQVYFYPVRGERGV